MASLRMDMPGIIARPLPEFKPEGRNHLTKEGSNPYSRGVSRVGARTLKTMPTAGEILLRLQRFDAADICTYARLVKIEYDMDKARANPLNHEGVTFEEAKPVLLDPYALTLEDRDSEYEQRFVTLGMGSKGRILITVWTLRADRIRIISAWKANQIQRRRYEQQF
ncbi:BrnT family toxin [Ectothiorhodospira sp. BSL-9]|uniref:BrnT family toxin n=1 Tax=Ectothiorhodospira sp. BSL-9 TaxID=1442136 RepID=UPI001F0A2EDE|nr:BrnT family toxin [Ectothiorhodospira sp. BSL-9]